MKIKQMLLFSSLVLAGIAIVSGTLKPFQLCGETWRKCMDVNYQIDLILIPTIPFFLFSLITYFMPEKVFRMWAWFALPWTVLSMLLIFLTPQDYGGGFGPQIVLGKGDTALVMSALFVLVSIIVIVVAYFRRHSNS